MARASAQYQGWLYPEFKGCFPDVRWLELETTEGLITAIPESPSVFVQVLSPKFHRIKFKGKPPYLCPSQD